jgi:hypothetical protein
MATSRPMHNSDSAECTFLETGAYSSSMEEMDATLMRTSSTCATVLMRVVRNRRWKKKDTGSMVPVSYLQGVK